MFCIARTSAAAALALLSSTALAQAVEVGACVSKSELNAILQREHQAKVVGVLASALIGPEIDRKIVPIKITFTSSFDRRTGWMLKEDGCTPLPSAATSEPVVGVRFYMALREPKVFEGPMKEVPPQAELDYNIDTAMKDCDQISPIGSRHPTDSERADVNRNRYLVEWLRDNLFLVVDGCIPANEFLEFELAEGATIMLQSKTVRNDGTDGPILTLIANEGFQGGTMTLTNNHGASIDADKFLDTTYIAGYEQFVVK